MANPKPKVVCITGAAGQIGYAIVPMICNGDMFGPTQSVKLHLLDITPMMKKMDGLVMEIEDGAFPLVSGVLATDNAEEAFKDADCAILLGAFPRVAGMERKDLMEKNIGIFKQMGQAIEKGASTNIKVLVVGNPANTNALVCAHYAPKVPKKNFTAMTRLDHNRALGQVALRTNTGVENVKNVIIWGNHSSTQYPDVNHGTVDGKEIRKVINDDTWLNDGFISTIQSRGKAIIDARKASSALSAGRAAVEHVRSWMCGTTAGEFVSMGVLSDDNPYGISSGIMYSFPCRCLNGEWTIVGDLPINDFSRQKMRLTEAELQEEKELAFSLI